MMIRAVKGSAGGDRESVEYHEDLPCYDTRNRR